MKGLFYNRMLLEATGVLGAGLVVLVVIYRRRFRKSFGKHDEADEIDINGKIVLITGGNSGLGKEAALEMAKRGAVVVIASRNMDLSRKAIEDIKSVTTSGKITSMFLDLGSMQSIREFAEEFDKQFPCINILINNAGVFCPLKKRMRTEDGLEFNFGINHLGHFLLTTLLVDSLKRGSPSRIVTVSSSLSEKGALNFDDLMLEKENPDTSKVNAYGNSKLANVLFSKQLSVRLKGTGVNTYVLCPGWVKTDLARYMDLRWWNYIVIVPAAFMFMRSTHQGVQSILHCALSRKIGSDTGKMYKNCGYWNTKSQISDEMAIKLWEASEKLVQRK